MTHAEARYTGVRRPLEIVSPDEVERIHMAALDVLSETGAMFHSDRALDVLQAHGAEVDRETTVARIPAELVEQALSTVPRSFTLGGRERSFDLPVDGEHAYLASDGCATLVREADGSLRASGKQDVYDAARVVEGLDNLSATSALVSAQDTPEESRVLHEFDACMRASGKHSVVVSMKDAREARGLLRMAEAVAGGSAELSARPVFSAILCTVSPLHMERSGMEMAFELAGAGIPLLLYPMPILGATSPVTPAGTAVVGAAEILAAVTAIQLACPGARLVHAGGPTALFMRTGSYFANVPEALLLRALQSQMARRWGIPAGLGWGGTKAKRPDAQSAYENTLGLMLGLAAGAEFVFGAGLLDSVQQMSFEELVIADETFGMATRLLRGVTVNHQTLAVDLIKELAFRGDYLFARQTRADVRDLWRARLGETASHESWRDAGSPHLEEKARAVADDILDSPAPEFPESLGLELDDIIAAVESGRL